MSLQVYKVGSRLFVGRVESLFHVSFKTYRFRFYFGLILVFGLFGVGLRFASIQVSRVYLGLVLGLA